MTHVMKTCINTSKFLVSDYFMLKWRKSKNVWRNKMDVIKEKSRHCGENYVEWKLAYEIRWAIVRNDVQKLDRKVLMIVIMMAIMICFNCYNMIFAVIMISGMILMITGFCRRDSKFNGKQIAFFNLVYLVDDVQCFIRRYLQNPKFIYLFFSKYRLNFKEIMCKG